MLAGHGLDSMLDLLERRRARDSLLLDEVSSVRASWFQAVTFSRSLPGRSLLALRGRIRGRGRWIGACVSRAGTRERRPFVTLSPDPRYTSPKKGWCPGKVAPRRPLPTLRYTRPDLLVLDDFGLEFNGDPTISSESAPVG